VIAGKTAVLQNKKRHECRHQETSDEPSKRWRSCQRRLCNTKWG
jgi:hypothetical protein